MIDRGEQTITQQFRQLLGINPVALVAGFQQSVLAGIANRDLADLGLEQIVQPAGPGSFFKGDQEVSA